jgi:hypothetical protein
MNAVDTTLQEELSRLMDRLAATVPAGSFEATNVTNPTLRSRLDDMDTSLALARATLLEGYGRWRKTLDDLENIWALAAWGSEAGERPSAAAEEAAEYATARAA